MFQSLFVPALPPLFLRAVYGVLFSWLKETVLLVSVAFARPIGPVLVVLFAQVRLRFPSNENPRIPTDSRIHAPLFLLFLPSDRNGITQEYPREYVCGRWVPSS